MFVLVLYYLAVRLPAKVTLGSCLQEMQTGESPFIYFTLFLFMIWVSLNLLGSDESLNRL